MSGPPEGPRQTVAEWLRYAEEDLAVAEREFACPAPAYHTLCFLTQAATEKYLKAYLIACGWALERTHDIVALLELCAGYEPLWQELSEEAAVLNEYVVAGRYPGDIAFEQIGRVEAEEALAVARRIRARARELLLEWRPQ
jgi:HEPN domain-containing protein